MNYRPMTSFLSEESIKAHIEYMRGERLRHSIDEKSFPEIKGMSPREISKINLKRSVKSEILRRKTNICLHECYFSSFVQVASPCKAIKKFYSSEDAFLYEILLLARDTDFGFVYVCLDERGRPSIRLSKENSYTFIKDTPLLALDVCEHAYFSDYGFDKEKYLRGALLHFDLTKLALDTAK